MKDMRSILFGALLGSLGVVGCGDDTTPTTDGGIAVGDGGRDMGARRDMAVTPPAYEFAIDTTAFENGAAYRTATEAAGLESIRGQCDCFFFQLDFADSDSCFAELSAEENPLPAEAKTCIDAAFTNADATVKAFESCRARLSGQVDNCLGAPDMCLDVETAVATCFGGDDPETPTAFDSATLECQNESGVTQTTFNAYNDAATLCLIGNGPDSCGTSTTPATGLTAVTGTTLLQNNHQKPPFECYGGWSEMATPQQRMDAYATFNAADFTFRYQAEVAGSYTFSTVGEGTDFDTILSVIADGSANCNGLTTIACNDDANAMTLQSSVTVTLTAGQIVQIVVDGWDGGELGDFSVSISGPGGGTADAGVDATVAADASVAADADLEPEAM
jgi:hypothetical protein